MAYKISRTFKVELVDPDGGKATFEFKVPPIDRVFESFDPERQASLDEIKEGWRSIAKDLVSVTDFITEDGKSVTPQEIVDFALDFRTMRALIAAYNAHVLGMFTTDREKKESKNA